MYKSIIYILKILDESRKKIMYDQAGFIFMGALTIDSGPTVYFKLLKISSIT